jgi:hypothetical protein
MSHGKYIILEISGFPAAIIFPRHLQHSSVAQALGHPVTSAGFVQVRQGKVEVYGESLSLNLRSNPADARSVSVALGMR